MAWQSGGGGGAPPPTQLGYAEITSSFTLANAGSQTPIPGLSITETVPAGVLYCMEFYALAVDEDDGSTAGERILINLLRDGVDVSEGINVNDVGGFGDATYVKSGTLTGDGASHTYTATVLNITAGADGAIVHASTGRVAYIRLLRLG